ncbi:hypothetical protein C8F04DRAFT_1394339 [Mycena alexandri]|uniref:DUF6534 domain-containing protein n=1 Tax=Mycena alexandri TaxID=1745969 RepID=A0AAD6T079_9AGAR|nr:hypothetical protein C8F04DRAFT_1394339 [Mycena alexandri]
MTTSWTTFFFVLHVMDPTSKFKFDDLNGSILISSWLTSLLYGLVISKSWDYLTAYPNDECLRKGLLLCCLVTSSLAMAAEFANVYYPTVTFWGNTVAVQKQYWPVPVYVISNSLTGFMVDAFLIHRVYGLTKNLWISLLLAFCVVLGLAGSIMVGVIITMANEISSRDKAAVAALIWTVATASADIFIAITLIWKLYTMKTSYKVTNRLIQRLAIGAMQTGSTTSTVAVATMVAYYIGKDNSNVPTAFHYLIGPLYVLTLLYNYNLRRRDGFDGSTRSGTRRSAETRLTNICMDGIQVHRTAIISVDAPNENGGVHIPNTQRFGDTKLNEDTDGEPYGVSDFSGAQQKSRSLFIPSKS